MNRLLLALIVILLLPFGSAKAQVKNGDFQKLFDWYAMERFDKCAYKAESYTRKDKYRRSPEPYLYLALCLYQGQQNPEEWEFINDFRDPVKDALKYAYKFRKYDKEGILYEENRTSLDKIREIALERALFYYNDNNYYKAASEFKRIMKVVPDDANIIFITGVSTIMAKNVGEGERLVNQALDSLRLYKDENRFVEDKVTHDALIKAFVSYTDYLSNNGRLDDALSIITLGRKLVPDNLKLKAQYKKLYALAPDEE